MTIELSRKLPSAVRAVVLFGSRARGDADPRSDTDIAVFASVATLPELIAVKATLEPTLPDANLSVYSTATARGMADAGSLFLWHLKLEGQVLLQRAGWLDWLLSALVPYTHFSALRDVGTFLDVLDDIVVGLNRSECTVLFEAATLFAILRSLGMIVSVLEKRPCFSRFGPIHYVQTKMGRRFPLSVSDIASLATAKLRYSGKDYGGDTTVQLNREWCLDVAHRIITVADSIKGAIHESTRACA